MEQYMKYKKRIMSSSKRKKKQKNTGCTTSGVHSCSAASVQLSISATCGEASDIVHG